MEYIHQLLSQTPLFALFITIALGYFVGKFRIKRFVLGGIAGSLLIGVLIGQFDIHIPAGISSIFFALFIYAVGYQGGPQFFRSLNRQTAVQLFSAVITCVLGLICVLIAAWWFHLDRGTAAGLAAGGLTQSAMIGTAGDALAKLGLSAQLTSTLQSNVAVGYAICYIFGSFGPILLLATVFPGIMGWDLREEAKQLAKQKQFSQESLEEGQFNALHAIDTRIYSVKPNSAFINKKANQLFLDQKSLAVEALMRDGSVIDVDTELMEGDLIALTGPTDLLSRVDIGKEVAKPETMQLTQEIRKVVITNKQCAYKTLSQCLYDKSINARGVFVTSISRLGEKMPAHADFVLHKGDELELLGRSKDIDPIAHFFGRSLVAASVTDFVFFGLGMAFGVLLGLLSFSLFGVSITLGSGVGCLFSGLVFGWLRSTHPAYATLPTGASNFLRDFGLAVFVASVGITAGPQAITMVKQYGLQLFFLGVGVTLIPQILSFYISYYLLRIKNPIILLATIAGGRSANPGFAALLDKAGNSTPVVAFTATYAIANILLTLWGPLIVDIITKN